MLPWLPKRRTDYFSLVLLQDAMSFTFDFVSTTIAPGTTPYPGYQHLAGLSGRDFSPRQMFRVAYFMSPVRRPDTNYACCVIRTNRLCRDGLPSLNKTPPTKTQFDRHHNPILPDMLVETPLGKQWHSKLGHIGTNGLYETR